MRHSMSSRSTAIGLLAPALFVVVECAPINPPAPGSVLRMFYHDSRSHSPPEELPDVQR